MTAFLAGEQPPDNAPRQAIRFRDGLVVVLALTTGALDAVTFLRLGKVFSSVITGNLALLGVAAGQQNLSLAQNGGLALAGYGLGVLIGGAIAGTPDRSQPVWPRQVTMTLAAELLVLAGFSGGWLAAAGHPAGAVRLALLAVAGAAMGMLLAAFIAGAVIGAIAALRAPSLVPAAVLIPLAAVAACPLPAAARAVRSLRADRGLAAVPVLTGKQVAQRVGELVQLGEVRFGQVGDHPVALLGELHPDDPCILVVGSPDDEPAGFRPVHEAHGAMALQQQVVGEFPDGRRLRAGVPLDGHEQLMLGRCKARRARLLFAPPHEAPERHTEEQVVPEVVVGRVNGTLLISMGRTG